MSDGKCGLRCNVQAESSETYDVLRRLRSLGFLDVLIADGGNWNNPIDLCDVHCKRCFSFGTNYELFRN